MKEIKALVSRNIKLFFKDKGLFFTSLITPLILLVLYTTFLRRVMLLGVSGVCEQNGMFNSLVLRAGQSPVKFDPAKVRDFVKPEYIRILNGLVGGQLISSLLSVSCVTVAFCSNMLIVQDKISGARFDLDVSPVRPWKLSLSYFAASAAVTLLVCLFALSVGLIYIAVQGWYLAFSDVLLLIADVVLLVLFGTSLSSVINFFLTSQGQVSAVGTIVSSGYGFISGAYMPISQFGTVLQHLISLLPGTYGTVLLRSHAMSGPFRALLDGGLPREAVRAAEDAVDCRLRFFGKSVSAPTMYAVLVGAVLFFGAAYLLLNVKKYRKKA